MVKLKMPKTVTSVSYGGKKYESDKAGGIVEVPPDAVEVLTSHGCMLVEYNKATKSLINKGS